jgi:hypothetical protein
LPVQPAACQSVAALVLDFQDIRLVVAGRDRLQHSQHWTGNQHHWQVPGQVAV